MMKWITVNLWLIRRAKIDRNMRRGLTQLDAIIAARFVRGPINEPWQGVSRRLGGWRAIVADRVLTIDKARKAELRDWVKSLTVV